MNNKEKLEKWFLSSFDEQNETDLTRDIGDLIVFGTKSDAFIAAVDLFVFFVKLCEERQLIEQWKPRLEFILYASDDLKVWDYAFFPDEIDATKAPRLILQNRMTESFYDKVTLGDFLFRELHPEHLELGSHRSFIAENMRNFQFTYTASRTQEDIDNGRPFHRVLSMNYYPDSLA